MKSERKIGAREIAGVWQGLDQAQRDNPNFGKDVVKQLPAFKKKNAKKLARQKSENASVADKEKLILRAFSGTECGRWVEDYLKAFHSGAIRLPEIEAAPQNYLHWAFHWATVYNFPSDLRKLADAVERVHKRVKGKGATFEIVPAKPNLAKVVSTPTGGSIPTKIRELRETAQELGATPDEGGNIPGFSERNARRIRAAMGMKPAKRGRPRKSAK